MPVKLLNSAILKWPDENTVLEKAKIWAQKTGSKNNNIAKISSFGSITTGRWGVGSDCDILIELEICSLPFMERSLGYNTSDIPVPVEIVVYTTGELIAMRKEGHRFMREFDRDSIDLYDRK